jgi:predicted DNA-binding WGR domain protein
MLQLNPTLYGKDTKGNIKEWSVYTDGATVTVGHGRLGGKITTKSYEAEAKNVGRSNETTPEEQAELEALAKWTKQLKRGYYHTIFINSHTRYFYFHVATRLTFDNVIGTFTELVHTVFVAIHDTFGFIFQSFFIKSV